MLQLKVPASSMFDEATSTFIESPEVTLQLEHSLISVSKWESRWEKPFFSNLSMTIEEMVDYIRCMSINNKPIDSSIQYRLTNENLLEIQRYIAKPMTATTFSKNMHKHTKSRKIITSEVIYGWMVEFGIPFECEKWHLNRLMTLIQVCSVNQSPNKKMSKRDTFAQNRALNAARRSKYGSKG